jgi:hypothetical protein
MSKRQRNSVALATVTLVVAAGAFLAIWLRGPRHRIHEYQAIQNDWSRQQVCDFFGVPPGDYRVDANRPPPVIQLVGNPPTEEWIADGVMVSIAFGEQGVIENMGFAQWGPEGLLARLRRLIGL